MTRAEHVQWCKDRALATLDASSVAQAYASMSRDLLKHEETANHTHIQLGMFLRMDGQLATHAAMRAFINGFH